MKTPPTADRPSSERRRCASGRRSGKTSTGRTRRDFLRAGATALAAGVSTSTVGCLSAGLPPLGSEQAYGRLDVPSPDDPVYRRWLPAPTALEGADPQPYSLAALEPMPVEDGVPAWLLERRASFKSSLDYFGVGYENYDRLIGSAFGTVVEAEFDRAAVTDAVTSTGYDPAGSYREYDLFARTDVPRRVAVGDGVLVWSNHVEHDAPDIETLVDAGSGRLRRYHEDNEPFRRVSDAAGTRWLVMAGPEVRGPLDEAELGADSFAVTDDAAYQVLNLLYPGRRVPTRTELKRAFLESYRLDEAGDAVDVEVDGRLATIEAQLPRTGSTSVAGQFDPPQVTWGASFDADSRTLTVRHEAGDPVDAGWLWYDVETEARPGRLDLEPLWRGAKRVGPGDSAEIDLGDRPDATGVDLVYSSGETDFTVLFAYELEGRA